MATMNYRRLGRSGLKVSELSLGSWVTYGNQLGTDVACECMAAAYDAGVNFFDNAEVYAKGESEVIMGEALRRLGWRRSRNRCPSSPSRRALAAEQCFRIPSRVSNVRLRPGNSA